MTCLLTLKLTDHDQALGYWEDLFHGLGLDYSTIWLKNWYKFSKQTETPNNSNYLKFR